jgi:hypothetical protein
VENAGSSPRDSQFSRGSALLGFAAAVFVFQQLPAIVGDGAGDWIDLFTPFAVIGTAALVLGRRAAGLALLVGVIGALLYVDGHGIHLAANSIGNENPAGKAKDVAHFWDEEWGHAEWHLGWFVLVLAFCLDERSRPLRLRAWLVGLTALVLGWTFFTNTVEGQTWWLELGATGVFVPWAFAARRSRPVLVTAAAAFALCAVLIGIWALWHGGVPQFTDVGYL